MICKVCGYEASENFSVCPYCGEENSSSFTNETRNSSPSSQIVDNSQTQSMNFNNAVFINRHINEIIDIKDVKIPVGINRDVIDKKNSTSSTFIMNEPIGGDFFPSQFVLPIIIGGMILWIPMTIFVNYILQFLFHIINTGGPILFFWIFYFIAIYLGVKLTSNKTKLTFSSQGIEAESRKGKFFIPREDVEDVYVKEIQGIQTSHGRGNITHHHPYIQYDMIMKLKKPLSTPYINENNFLDNFFSKFSSDTPVGRIINIFKQLSSNNSTEKNEIKLLKEHYIRSWYFNSPVFKDIKTTKNLTYYIVQQIRKVFDIK